MKSLAELKRNANTGRLSLEIIEWNGNIGDDIPERLRGIRRVIKGNSVGLILRNADGEESELTIRTAKLIDYDGEMLTIYLPGQRDMTAQERSVLDGWYKVQEEYLNEYPYSDCYWKMKDYFKGSPCPWMVGLEKVKGKYYSFHDNKVTDDSIKGDAALRYKVHFK